MGRFIVKQPNKKLAVFSTVVDDFVVKNATPNEIQDYFVERATEQQKERVSHSLHEIEKYGKVRSCMDYKECLKQRRLNK